ncbi:alpha/beta fold hydrolase [Aquisalinus flavus]|uniref:Alpha/beta hydrolase n=1 Tax=Aquisalinus flavus TaxID=1526572 RepID=A0A8J2Y5U5_9PROT|nr:alpha/beta hydrolase [Aquisalinus flavus]MBD0425338.1 alpha/beta hydrolase [Aquisalinus flavus]UNE49011.1 alpha/beta hydrolase [Aquisalinus flavus]GGD16887.1 alpha/beta hydrolase [Aquisalinus flavus]
MTGENYTFETPDGLTLHATVRRHPAAGVNAPSIICLPGLTRNERDFEGLAGWLTSRAFTGPACEVVALSLRGRGASDRDPDYSHYHPSIYAADVKALMEARGLTDALFIGTSLGGIVTMLIAANNPDAVSGAVLNDIGPQLAPEGLARIAGYVGGSGPWDSWAEAAQGIKAINGVAFPKRHDSFWQIFARRVCTMTDRGIELDYDTGIAKALAEAGPAPSLEPGFAALAGPLLCVRGALSDLLTREIVSTMKDVQPQMDVCEIANTGHAPTLEEPAARRAIQKWLERV